jgi:hypothetical protein
MARSNVIAAQMKTWASDGPVRGIAHILTSVPNRCDHTHRICATPSCVESWSIDWRLYLNRTAPGRTLAATLGLTDSVLADLAADGERGSYVRLT